MSCNCFHDSATCFRFRLSSMTAPNSSQHRPLRDITCRLVGDSLSTLPKPAIAPSLHRVQIPFVPAQCRSDDHFIDPAPANSFAVSADHCVDSDAAESTSRRIVRQSDQGSGNAAAESRYAIPLQARLTGLTLSLPAAAQRSIIPPSQPIPGLPSGYLPPAAAGFFSAQRWPVTSDLRLCSGQPG